jgi:hypothetical protein
MTPPEPSTAKGRMPATALPREFPTLPASGRPQRPLSLVVVHYSDDLTYNLMRSPCVREPINELIVVDNRGNLYYETLSQAIQAGLARVRHELVAVVHEDVLLPAGWQQALERSLQELEGADPEWALVGSVGWREDNSLAGHYSDPSNYSQLFDGRRFEPVVRIDEQLMVMRRSRPLPLDPALPSIHNIGRDLPLAARAQGRCTYVVDAPTIHKFADAEGRPILCRADSPKIQARTEFAWRADHACSQEYFQRKWNLAPPMPPRDMTAAPAALDQPLVLLSRGGGGSRLLATLARDAGVFTGNQRNGSGDCIELVLPIYKCVLNRHHQHADWQCRSGVDELREAAQRMHARGGRPACWGFKLPESMLVLEELLAAFPQARFLHLVRDPLATSLRRTHMTSRLDNPIGHVAVRAAYRHCARPLAAVHDDPPPVHMALGSAHQIGGALDFLAALDPGRSLQIRYEDVLTDPLGQLARAARWIHGGDVALPAEPELVREVDPARPHRSAQAFAPEVEAQVAALLRDLRVRLGYAAAG